jgi:hypothetical protein
MCKVSAVHSTHNFWHRLLTGGTKLNGNSCVIAESGGICWLLSMWNQRTPHGSWMSVWKHHLKMVMITAISYSDKIHSRIFLQNISNLSHFNNSSLFTDASLGGGGNIHMNPSIISYYNEFGLVLLTCPYPFPNGLLRNLLGSLHRRLGSTFLPCALGSFITWNSYVW